jgi:hypothetical protein
MSDILNINELDKKLGAWKQDGQTPWDYLELNPFVFAKYMDFSEIQFAPKARQAAYQQAREYIKGFLDIDTEAQDNLAYISELETLNNL